MRECAGEQKTDISCYNPQVHRPLEEKRLGFLGEEPGQRVHMVKNSLVLLQRSVTAYEDLWHWGKWMPNLLCWTGSELTLNPWDLKGSSPGGVEAYGDPVTNGPHLFHCESSRSTQASVGISPASSCKVHREKCRHEQNPEPLQWLPRKTQDTISRKGRSTDAIILISVKQNTTRPWHNSWQSKTVKQKVVYLPLEDGMKEHLWASQVVVLVKASACQFRRWKRWRFDPWVGRSPEEGMATHASILAWRIPWTEEPG